jgi:hypothetical protein
MTFWTACLGCSTMAKPTVFAPAFLLFLLAEE